ncbi:carbohydrate ABC transporter permease [Paenibacillus hexagrammi]|uniref:Carbohydrate ABC transporter permease n=1 Tax=Paenibacillus hexagrammi TaxID=2908839 RepID=A0ABY3SM75_9BACL|nr:carbohydrate ABC transporter permease [Paenibacillus sp. YPD9-1]UJF34296.1 carbohydrate ABC transporter permease [Paenibacillus sp. YPD9-1]
MRASRGERIFYSVNYILLFLISITCLYPLINILAISLSSNDAIISGKVQIWPVGFSLTSYDAIMKGSSVLDAFRNSLIITIVGAAICMLFTLLAAYPLSRKEFYGRKAFTLAIVFTMLFNGGLIPNYLLVKSLGLIDSYFAIWLPTAISVYNMLIMKSYFENLPQELEDAARIDGASEWTFIIRIVLPLSAPMLATIALFYTVGLWNSFLNVLIYINDPLKYNLSVLVQQMVSSQSIIQDFSNNLEEISKLTPEGVKAAGVIILILPVMIVYPFVQKYFVKGAMIGAIKG